MQYIIIYKIKKMSNSKIINKVNTVKEILDSMNEIESNYQNQISNLDAEIQGLKLKIVEQDKKILELNDKVKSKTSSAIWESMQVQLQEKDKVIEQIKKDLDFYKRQYQVKNAEIETKTDLDIKSEKKPINLVPDTVSKPKIEEKQEPEEINVQVEKKSKKDKKEKKSKDKKSKKSEKVEIADLDDLDDLERDLMG